MKSTSERLQEIQQHGFHLDFGTILNQAFENYKKIALTVGSLILILILLFTIIGGATAISFGITNFTEFVTNIDLTKYSRLLIILEFLTKVIGTALTAPLTAGILKIAQDADRNQSFGFSTAFSYYRSIYFKNIFTASLIIVIITSSVDSLANLLTEFNENETLNRLINLFIGIFNGLANLFTMFTIPLIIFGELHAKEAIKGSFTLILKNFWPILGLALLGAFCAIMFGLMAFCIGIFFTLPFMYSLQYIIYRNVMGIENEKHTL